MRRIGSTENVMKRGSRFLSLGVISSLVLPVGCGISPTGQTKGSSIPTVYVVQENAATHIYSILEFPANSQGSVAPLATVTEPSGTYISSIAVDSTGNLYVAVYFASNQDEILVYAAGATGAATPIRTITSLPSSPNTSNSVLGMAVDTAGQLYVSTPSAISVFAPDATGNATPVRQISGASTQLGSGPIAVDTQGNIYVGIYTFSVCCGTSGTILSGPGYVLVFSSTANGNSAPIRSLTMDLVMGLAVDAAGNIFVADDIQSGLSASEVMEFTPGQNGYVAPAQILPITQSQSLFGVALDTAGNLYLPSQSYSTDLQPSIQVLAPGNLSGNIPPILTFNSTAWTVPIGGGIAVH
jgi:hypothetical protein